MMMAHNFKDPFRQKQYDHYATASIRPDIGSSDRRMYWFGRFGYTAQASHIDKGQFAYPAWRAGYDLYKKHGAPDFAVHTAVGPMREYSKAK